MKNIFKKTHTTKTKEQVSLKSKRGVIISSVVAGVAVATGIVVSLVLINPNLFPPKARALDVEDVSELDDEIAPIMAKYQKNATKDDLTKVFNCSDLVNIALNKVSQLESLKTITTGSIKASIATQTVYSMYVRDGDERMYENISAGFVKVGIRFYQDLEGVVIYKGSNVGVKTANWVDGEKEEISIDEYDDVWGKDLTRRSIYIISSKTVLDTSIAEKTSDGYKVTLDLDPTYGSARYVKQMVQTSGLDKDPVFYSIKLTYELDNDLLIKHVDMNSNYDVHAVTWVNSDERLEEQYYYGDYEIPSLTEDCDYID